MSFIIVCPQCERQLRVADTAAGKSVRCPACKTLIPPAAQAPSGAITEKRMPPPAVVQEVTPTRPRLRETVEAGEGPEGEFPSKSNPAKKRSGVALILGLVLGCGCLGLLLVGGGVGAVVYFALNKTIPEKEWQAFSPPNSGCTILMPGTPTPQQTNILGITTNQFQVDRKKENAVFLVGFINVPQNLVRPSLLEDVANGSRNGALAKMPDAKETSYTAITLGNLPGREYQIKPPGRGTFIGRIYLAKVGLTHRIYLVLAGGDNIEPNKGDAARFFDSFQVTAPATPPVLGGAPAVQAPQQPVPTAPPGERAVWLDETSGTQTLALAFSPDNATLAVAHWDKKVRLWDINGRRDRQVMRLKGSVMAVAFSSDGKRLACGSDNGNLASLIVPIWDVSDINAPKELHRIALKHTRDYARVKVLCFAPDGKSLAVALVPDSHSGSEVVLWDVENNKLRAALNDCKEDVKKLAFTPDGSIVILMPSSVRIWDPATKQIRREIKGQKPAEQFVTTALSSDGQTLAAMCRDNKLRMWRLSDGVLQHTWPVSLDLIRQEGCPFEFTPNGKYLAMRGQGAKFHMWDTQTGKELRVAHGGREFENIDVMTFSSDSQLLAFHGNNGPRIVEVARLIAGN